MKVIGKPRRRVDGRAKVTGQTRFADDLAFPRMLHCKLLRSRHPHARLRRVDVSRALAAPGVKAVPTGNDFPFRYGFLPVGQPLCREKVRMVADPIAAVIARTEDQGWAATELIDVDYEVLPTIADPIEALSTPGPRIHDYGDHGNVHKAVALEFGDVDAALAGAGRVFEDLFFYQGNTHLPIEQHAGGKAAADFASGVMSCRA